MWAVEGDDLSAVFGKERGGGQRTLCLTCLHACQ